MESRDCIDREVEIHASDLPKRLYIEGAHIETTCPECGHIFDVKLDGDRINYPDLGTEFAPYEYGVDGCCPECEHEWDEEILLTFKLTVIGRRK